MKAHLQPLIKNDGHPAGPTLAYIVLGVVIAIFIGTITIKPKKET